MEELWDDYFLYLIWRCHLEKEKKLTTVFIILHGTEFFYIMDRDDNRAGDGIELRYDYEIPPEYDIYANEFINRPCSVFEMMIGLAIRVDLEIIGDPAEEHPEKFFMEMIENLGLDLIGNPHHLENTVNKILQRWLNREFDEDGSGSPFPVIRDRRDQRKLEIYDQMNSYISENYG